MLFIGNHQRKGSIDDLLLNQRVCANDQVRLPGGNLLISLSFHGSSHGSHQQNRPKRHVIFFYIALNGLKVLDRQHFGGCHQCTLVSIGCSHHQGQDRHDRLAGTHISLHQTIHTVRTSQIILNILPHLLLCLRQRKGQLFQKSDRICGFKHTIFVLQPFAKLLVLAKEIKKSEKLVKDQSSPRLRQTLHILWKVNAPDSLFLGKQMIGVQQGLRIELLFPVTCQHCLFHQLPKCLVG